MDKIQNIEKKLYLYSIYDRELNSYDSLLTGFNDKDACAYYLSQFNLLKSDLEDYVKKNNIDNMDLNKKLDFLLSRIHNSCIYCVGVFSYSTGEFTNIKNLLVDLSDFKFDEKNESEEIKNNEK